MSALNTSSLCVTIVSVAPAGAPAKVVRMVRDVPNGVASDHYSRSTRSSPRTSNTEPLGASPYGDEDDPQLRVRIGPHRHDHLRRCRRGAPRARPSLCFRLSAHAHRCLALDATTLALHHRRLCLDSRQVAE